MVQIYEIPNKQGNKITLGLSRNEELFVINEDTIDFSLISKNLTIQEFKDIHIIFWTLEPDINTTLIEKNVGEYEEYNVNDNHCIFVRN